MAEMLSVVDARRRSDRNFWTLVGGLAVFTIIVAVLNVQQQDRLATVRDGQVTGQKTASGQRSDQTQLTCAIWELVRKDAGSLSSDTVKSANAICSTVPTPVPTK
jgi:hypothetical protein